MPFTIENVKSTVNAINQTLVDYEIAKVAGKPKECAQSLRLAFEATCKFLKEMLASDLFDQCRKAMAELKMGPYKSLRQLPTTHEAMQILRSQDGFQKFINVERNLLLKAGFDPEVTQHILKTLQYELDEILDQDIQPDEFKQTVMAFKTTVCKSDEKDSNAMQNLLRFAGGVALVLVDIGAHMGGMATDPMILDLSVALGVGQSTNAAAPKPAFA